MSVSATTAATTPGTGAPARRSVRSLPWLVLVYAFLSTAVPATLVFAGPLRSNGSPATLLSFVMFGLVVLGFVRGSGSGPDLRVRAVPVILVLYLLLQLLTYATAATHPLSADVGASTTREALHLFGYVGAGLYVYLHVRGRRDLAAVIGTLALGLTISAVIGLVQAANGPDIRSYLRVPGMVFNRQRAPGARDGLTRVIGSSDHPIEFAILMACGVVLMLHVARFAATRLSRQLAWICLVPLLLAVPASVSRSAVLALAAALVVYAFCLSGRMIANAVVAGAALLVVYYGLAPNVINALYQLFAGAGTDDSISGRTDDYGPVFASFADHPWLGLGLGTNPTASGRLLDNEWLALLLQGGVTSVVAALLVFGVATAAARSALRSAPGAVARSATLALSACVAAVFVSFATFNTLAYPQVTSLLFVVVGLLGAHLRILRQAR